MAWLIIPSSTTRSSIITLSSTRAVKEIKILPPTLKCHYIDRLGLFLIHLVMVAMHRLGLQLEAAFIHPILQQLFREQKRLMLLLVHVPILELA